MCIDPEILETLSGILDTNSNDPLICYPVNITGRGRNNEKMILFANESNIMIFDNKIRTKMIQPSLNKTWFQLKRIISHQDNVLQLHFDKGYFEMNDEAIPLIIVVIVRYVCNILTDKEVPEVDLETFDYNIINKSQNAAFYRLRALVLAENFQYDSDTVFRFKDFISLPFSEIDVYTIDPIGHHIPYILRALQVNNRINSLIVQTPMKGVLWKDLGDFVKYNTSISTIKTYEPFTDEFQFFINGFEENPKSKIKNLYIMNSKITRKYNSYLQQLLKAHRLEKLVLDNCLVGPSATDFVDVFASSTHMQALRSLSLDRSKNLDIYQLLRVSTTLQSLSLNNCGIELCLFFGYLSYFSDLKIKDISLNGNYAKAAIKETLTLPTSLRSISISDITLAGDNILKILLLFSKFKIKLDISRVKTNLSNWKNLSREFDFIIDPQFTGLGWSENPIYLETLDFFDRCKNLKYLKIDGCVNPGNALFSEVMSYLETNDTIEELEIPATKKIVLEESSMNVIISLIKSNKNLTYVNINGQTINDNNVEFLCDALLENLSISKFDFSLFEVKDGKKVCEFYTKLVSRVAPLQLPMPSIELRKLMIYKQLKEAEVIQINQLIDLIMYESPDNKFQREIPEKVEREKKRRIPPKPLDYQIPPDEEVINAITEENPDEWDVIQDMIPLPNEENIANSLKQSMNLDLLMASVTTHMLI
ncbi:hypothetical protein TVAG_337920 [Trichomonas vaginalis G3]|uniref:Leucine Rich Repeat family protein n=1 Tax=Trichomonas vaginalis (strain ATCC PRA-98 / G3) TaxID=412133 RepID=A2FFF1_TRIV3|nr:hypothetical protein TVAG_337920 [Trichomonas vaginalis G3]|eukprot:XP_001309290.1 hypothetical protein [Trichomonas vaginalis G3]